MLVWAFLVLSGALGWVDFGNELHWDLDPRPEKNSFCNKEQNRIQRTE